MAVTAQTPQAEAAGTALAGMIGGRPFLLHESDKPLYHLAAAVASNLLVALQSQAGELMRQATHQSSVADALQLLAPLVRTTLENALRLGSGAGADWSGRARRRRHRTRAPGPAAERAGQAGRRLLRTVTAGARPGSAAPG